MRPSSAAWIPLAAGLAWLAYKSPYLTLDTPDALKALLVSPGIALLVAAAFLAFPDPRRRLGASMAAVGAVALLWAALETRPRAVWTFYTPYSTMSQESSPFLHDSSPALAAAILLFPLGLALFFRRSTLGALLLGLAALGAFYPPSYVWTALGAAWGFDEPRRYGYYYASPLGIERFDVAIPIALAFTGVALLARRRRSAMPPRNGT